jgi:signal peptidase II
MTTVPASRYLLFVSLAGSGCAADLATKSWIFSAQPLGHPSRWLIGEVFGFTTSLNEGALAGIGQGKTPLFAALSVAAAVAIVYWLFVRGAARDRWLTLALGSIMAGILGNLYDRLGLPGLTWPAGYRGHAAGDPVYAVRDWLHFKIDGVIEWPIFNLADSLLVCGAALLVWHAFWVQPEQESAAAANPPAAA